MRRIGLFGGMFDPVHLGHIHAARMVADELELDNVIFIPARIPPHKQNGCYVSGDHRISMLRLALDGEPRFEVSDFEILKTGTSYSYITVEYFRNLFPNDKLYFIIGDEAYALLHTWKSPEIIRKAADFVVVTRDGTPPPTDALYVQIPQMKISSTEVRNELTNGRKGEKLLPDCVAEYIEKNGLYR